jgi:hypothetical protein
MNYEDITEAFDKLSTKEQLEVLAILSKAAYKAAGGKKSKLTGEKKPLSEGSKIWNEEVSAVHAEMKAKNPKATRFEAMAEAGRRRDAHLSPEELRKKEEEREKRKAKKEEKKSTSSKPSSKSSSKVASAFASDTESDEEPKPKATKSKAVKAKIAEIFGSDSEAETEAEKPKDEKPKKEKSKKAKEPKTEEPKEEKINWKSAKLKGNSYIYNAETGAAYESLEGDDGKSKRGAYVGKFSKNPIPKLDDSISEEDCTA